MGNELQRADQGFAGVRKSLTMTNTDRRTPFSLLSSPNYNRTVNVSKNREYIVKPGVITRMGNGEAYVLSLALGELVHLILIG